MLFHLLELLISAIGNIKTHIYLGATLAYVEFQIANMGISASVPITEVIPVILIIAIFGILGIKAIIRSPLSQTGKLVELDSFVGVNSEKEEIDFLAA